MPVVLEADTQRALGDIVEGLNSRIQRFSC